MELRHTKKESFDLERRFNCLRGRLLGQLVFNELKEFGLENIIHYSKLRRELIDSYCKCFDNTDIETMLEKVIFEKARSDYEFIINKQGNEKFIKDSTWLEYGILRGIFSNYEIENINIATFTSPTKQRKKIFYEEVLIPYLREQLINPSGD